MLLISHRGNLEGPNPEKENSPEYIFEAIKEGYLVEVDVWHVNNKWYFGHDNPQYEVKYKFISDNKKNIWFHCKDIYSLYMLNEIDHLNYEKVNFFWHQTDDYTLTSNGYIWTYPGKDLTNKSICVLPEQIGLELKHIEKCYGICSDYIKKWKI